MKKYLRLMLCVFTALLSVAFVCSCESIDDMRARQAFYDEDGNIVYDGIKYILLPRNIDMGWKYDGEIYVTESGTPVLLSQIRGDKAKVLNGGEGLYRYYWEENGGEDISEHYYYLREDRYEQIFDSNGEILNEKLCERFPKDGNERYILTDEEQDTVEKIIDECLDESIYVYEWSDVDVGEYDCYLELIPCSEDGSAKVMTEIIGIYGYPDGSCAFSRHLLVNGRKYFCDAPQELWPVLNALLDNHGTVAE